MEDGVQPDLGDGACITYGPAPLVRNDNKGHLQLQDEGKELLCSLKAPVRIVFAIGGSRCGKSTASNALAFGPSREADGFVTGDSFDPVTSGIDVAARVLPNGGTLVVADCEGAFHACGSSRSARGFGTLGLLAYHMSSTLLHVSMGSIDERDIEAIGFLAAHGSCLAGIGDEEMQDAPALSLPPSAVPTLVLLVNGARFELNDAAARRLLRVPDDGVDSGRGSARAAIARGFRGTPAMEALPTCEHAGYWPKVHALRRRAAEAQPLMQSSGLQASGLDLVDRLVELIGVLNGEEKSVAIVREPEAATEAFYRSMHLEPLVEEISRRFAATAAAGQSKSGASSGSDAIEDALAEFDRRSAWLTGEPTGEGEPAGEPPAGDLGAAGDGNAAVSGGVAHVRTELVADIRSRLAARLAGISEALARGRQQGEKARRSRGPRPPALGGMSPSSFEKENVNPTPPSTPSKKSLTALENKLEEVDIQVENLSNHSQEELIQLQADVSAMQNQIVQLFEEDSLASQKATAETKAAQDRWQLCFRKLSEARLHAANEQATTSGGYLADLESSLLELGGQAPDVVGHATQLTEIRETLEAQRLQRHEAGNAAQRVVEVQLRALRESVSEQGQQLAVLRETTSRQFSQSAEELRLCLQEEKSNRIDRHKALHEVVERLAESLHARVEAPPSRPSCTPPRPSCTPTVPLRGSASEASRVIRTTPRASSALIGSSPCSSRSATPRRSVLPAPPPGQ